MAAQLEASDLDLARLEEFAGKVSTDQAAAYNAILRGEGLRPGQTRVATDPSGVGAVENPPP